MDLKDLIKQELEKTTIFKPVGVLVMNAGEKYLLLKRSNNVGEFKLHWAFIGGAIEKGEDPEKATLREVGEEMGFKPRNIQFFGKTFFRNRPIYVYTSDVNEEFKPNLNWENTDFGWFTRDEIEELSKTEMVIPNVLSIINDIENGHR